MNLDLSRLHEYLADIAGRATPLEWALQLGAIVASFALGWSFAHLACARVKPGPRWKFGEGGCSTSCAPSGSTGSRSRIPAATCA